MTWNYRVMKMTHGGLEIRSVYYDDAGNARSYGDPAFPPAGEDLEDLAVDMTYMTQAVSRPVLNQSDFEEQEVVSEVNAV
jgi:hypothetical protein